MIKVFCMNRKGQRFIKEFDSPYLAKKFIIKCRYGTKVYIENYSTNSPEANDYLAYVF